MGSNRHGQANEWTSSRADGRMGGLGRQGLHCADGGSGGWADWAVRASIARSAGRADWQSGGRADGADEGVGLGLKGHIP